MSLHGITLGHIRSLSQQYSAKGATLKLYYFTLKTTPGRFRVTPVEECLVIPSAINTSWPPGFCYKTKTGAWSSQKNSPVKINTEYFLDKQTAEQAFKESVGKAIQKFNKDIAAANDALKILNTLK